MGPGVTYEDIIYSHKLGEIITHILHYILNISCHFHVVHTQIRDSGHLNMIPLDNDMGLYKVHHYFEL